ncbi:hypothetical protein DFH11DRAFT_1598144 [Phellopilus nigrolimitatus]|nr:hypothetical protein DFH11DRAFT_1598144 [Phellopilus nigrolimitatus]
MRQVAADADAEGFRKEVKLVRYQSGATSTSMYMSSGASTSIGEPGGVHLSVGRGEKARSRCAKTSCLIRLFSAGLLSCALPAITIAVPPLIIVKAGVGDISTSVCMLTRAPAGSFRLSGALCSCGSCGFSALFPASSSTFVRVKKDGKTRKPPSYGSRLEIKTND